MIENPNPESRYDTYIVAFSGGKDSLACALHLIDLGVPRHQIELWHHAVDGAPGGSTLMDWPVTEDYCRQVAKYLGVKIYFSWKEGGFEREMLRDGTPTAPTSFETPGEGFGTSGGSGPIGTRKKFPQVSPDLSVRWCSSYLKIDVCASAIRNQPRFDHSRTLVITGERAEESASRAKYKIFEPHRADGRNGKKKRLVDQWRPVHGWKEPQVWNLIKKHRINPHPAYQLGWGRLSCAACIFGSPDQWASLRAINPRQFSKIASYESSFGTTIQRKLNVIQLADKGTPYPNMDPYVIQAALSYKYREPVILPEGRWDLPPGAFGDSCGPV